MKKQTRKLALPLETIRQLDTRELAGVAGGFGPAASERKTVCGGCVSTLCQNA